MNFIFVSVFISSIRSQDSLPPYSCPAGSAIVKPKPNDVKVVVNQTSGVLIDGSLVQLFDELTCNDVSSPQCFGCDSGIEIQCASAIFE